MIINGLSRISQSASKLLLCALFLFINTESFGSATTAAFDSDNLSGLTPTVVKQAVNAYEYAIAHQNNVKSSVLTVINFDQPSYKRRLWVIDTTTGKVQLALHVAQGKNSGSVQATRFSNAAGSYESSPGVYTTLDTYDGKHGKSMRVAGLESGINSNALKRAIVIHPAWYATPSFIKQHGYTGRSWGCFAVDPNQLDTLLQYINHHAVLFAYAPLD